MSVFEFDDSISFDENLEAFLTELDALDSEMAAILRETLSGARAVIKEGAPDRKARAAFNEAVLERLDALLASEEEQ